MSLTCSCDSDGEWWYEVPRDFETLATKRWRKCCSCGDRISVGALALKFQRYRSPYNDVEESIHGDEVPLAPRWMCEDCGDQYLNLDALGFCINLPQDMHELRCEYIEVHGRKAP